MTFTRETPDGFRMAIAVVFANPDGSTAVLHPAPEMFDPNSRTRALLALHGKVFETDDEVMDFIIAKDVPPGAMSSARIVPVNDLPEDRSYRNALTVNLGYDMPKARSIHRQRLRELRAPLLSKLDVEYQRADEAGDLSAKKQIAAKKQALRDATAHPAIDQAMTIEALSKAVPAVLA